MHSDLPKFLMVASTFPMEIQPFVTSHARAMVAKGWQVSVAAREIDSEQLVKFQAGGRMTSVHDLGVAGARIAARKGLIRHMHTLTRFGTSLRTMYPGTRAKKREAASCVLYDIAKSLRPDVMHAHFGGIGLVAAPVAKRLGIPLFVSFHGEELMEHESEAPLSHYNNAMVGAVAVVYSGYMERMVRERLDCAVERVPFGVDRTLFAPTARAEAWPSDITMLIVGRLIDYKGQADAIKALSILRQSLPGRRFTLKLAGDGPQRAEYEELARSVGGVEFLGQCTQEEVGRHMAEADVLLIPSAYGVTGARETFCLVALEGMSCGIPTLAADSGALPETVAAGGMIFAHNNPESLAQTIAAMMENETPASMSAKALRRAGDFSVDKMAMFYDRIARTALAR